MFYQTHLTEEALYHLQASITAMTADLECKWAGCSDMLDSPETLYQHLCDKHIGRKSQNNVSALSFSAPSEKSHVL
jgi:hypothetical protein